MTLMHYLFAFLSEVGLIFSLWHEWKRRKTKTITLLHERLAQEQRKAHAFQLEVQIVHERHTLVKDLSEALLNEH